MRLGLFIFFILSLSFPAHAQNLPVDIQIKWADSLKKDAVSKGRLFLFLNQNPNVEPRTQTWPSAGNSIFAKNFENLNLNELISINELDSWLSTTKWLEDGSYYLQVLWDQDQTESRIDAPGNIFSLKQKVEWPLTEPLEIMLSEMIPERRVVSHPLVREISMKSKALSDFWGDERSLKATILLPKNYDSNNTKAYAIRYNVSGYGGRYTRINRIVGNEEFMSWWESDEAPEVINVFLDGEGPFGDSYQLDSDNSGPYGQALIYELIPFIEQEYRGTTEAKNRFVDGCSTGGWVSLALQLFYPDVFDGVFSYSPDAIEFTNYQLINAYEDENAYVNEHGYERPVMRDTNGEPVMALRDFIQYENVLGASNTYLNSGGQFSAHTALYSPKGENGLPKPLFDPISGKIDSQVAEAWKKYDLKLHIERNWESIGPKLANKIYIWAADMDQFYLNPATRIFEQSLNKVSQGGSGATIEYEAMAGHCQRFSHKRVLEQIQQKLSY